jgi:hypothetical protein
MRVSICALFSLVGSPAAWRRGMCRPHSSCRLLRPCGHVLMDMSAWRWATSQRLPGFIVVMCAAVRCRAHITNLLNLHQGRSTSPGLRPSEGWEDGKMYRKCMYTHEGQCMQCAVKRRQVLTAADRPVGLPLWTYAHDSCNLSFFGESGGLLKHGRGCRPYSRC